MTAGRDPEASSILRYLALTGFLVALSLVLTAGRGVSVGDESWFLQVAARLAGGERLYDEVFYSPLPLAPLLMALPVALFGAHLAVVEVAIAVTWAATTLVALAISRRAGAGRGIRILLVGAMVVTATPQRNSLYTPLAMLFLVVCLLLVLDRGCGSGAVVAAGASAGLSFAAKQTVGLAALLALVATLWLASGTRGVRLRRVGAAACGFGGVASAVAVGLAATGTLADAIRLGFLGKGEYVEHGGLSYTHAVGDAVRLLGSSPLTGIENLAPLVVPPVALVVVAVAALGSRRRSPAGLVGMTLFAGAAAVAAFPRFGTTHLAWANPPALVAIAVALTGLGAPRQVRGAIGVLVGCAAAGLLAQPPLAWARGQVRLADVPGYAGIPLATETIRRAELLRSTTPSARRVFYVEYDAAFRYLVTGARNPTPWDIPAASNIGPREVRRVLAEIEEGRLDGTCLAGSAGYREDPSLRPLALEVALREALRRERTLPTCVLYAR